MDIGKEILRKYDEVFNNLPRKGEGNLKFGRSMVSISGIAEQYYCEQKLDLESEFPLPPTEQMIKGEAETIIGMNVDATFGPLIMFGLGGIYVEVLQDVAFKMYPLTSVDAHDMISSIKGYKLLTGYRGKEPVDIAKLEETLLRVSQLAGDFPQIQSLEMNPFLIAGLGSWNGAVDARVVLA